MITKQQCKNCSHDSICSFKKEYDVICQGIEDLAYEISNNGFKCVKDSKVDVVIKCPHIMPTTVYRDVADRQCP